MDLFQENNNFVSLQSALATSSSQKLSIQYNKKTIFFHQLKFSLKILVYHRLCSKQNTHSSAKHLTSTRESNLSCKSVSDLNEFFVTDIVLVYLLVILPANFNLIHESWCSGFLSILSKDLKWKVAESSLFIQYQSLFVFFFFFC